MKDTFDLYRPLVSAALDVPKADFDNIAACALLYARASQQVAHYAAEGDAEQASIWRANRASHLEALKMAIEFRPA